MKRHLVTVQNTEETNLTRLGNKSIDDVAYTALQFGYAAKLMDSVNKFVQLNNLRLKLHYALTNTDGFISVVFWCGQLRASVVHDGSVDKVYLSKPVCEGEDCKDCFASLIVNPSVSYKMIVTFLNCKKNAHAAMYIAGAIERQKHQLKAQKARNKKITK